MNFELTIRLAKICIAHGGACPVKSGIDFIKCQDCYFQPACNMHYGETVKAIWTDEKLEMRRKARISLANKILRIESMREVLGE